MALPLEPDMDEMFPDTLVPPFIAAPEVESLAGVVIATWDEFRALRDAIDSEAHPLSIAFVFDTKKLTEDEDRTIHSVVKVTKAQPLWRVLTGHHVAVAFREVYWRSLDDVGRRSYLHHALMHIEALGGKVALRDHPVEAFPWTYRRYGPLSLNETQLYRAAGLWSEDHPSEPTPLRPVEIDEALAGLRRVAEETGNDITITHGGRSATIKGKGGSVQAGAARRAPADDRVGELRCQGSNHVPGHTPGCPSYVVS